MTATVLAVPPVAAGLDPAGLREPCDHGDCPADALVRLASPGLHRDLVFCGHHYWIHAAALAAQGFTVTEGQG